MTKLVYSLQNNMNDAKDKPALILQHQCLGDLIFIQKIIKELSLRHSKVIIPVFPQYLEIQDYFLHRDNISYYNYYDTDFPFSQEYKFMLSNRKLVLTPEHIRIMEI